MKEQIVLNMAFCEPCNQVLISATTHDFRSCEGNHGFVDGGRSYVRRGGSLIDYSVVLRHGHLEWFNAFSSDESARVSDDASLYSLVGG